MMRFGRRRLLIAGGSLTGVAAIWAVLVDRSPADHRPSVIPERLGLSNGSTGQDLIDLGRKINARSPDLAALVSQLVERQPDAPVAQIVLTEVRGGSHAGVVSIDGWQFPELIAGVAGALAAAAR